MPRKQGKRFTTKIIIFTTAQQKNSWKHYCDLNGISMSQAIRMCMSTVLREEQSISYSDEEIK